MKTRVAINGFGRIGRNAFKVAFERSDLEIVAINDLTDTKTLAHLLKHDSNYGTYDKKVGFDDKGIIVDGNHVADHLMMPSGAGAPHWNTSRRSLTFFSGVSFKMNSTSITSPSLSSAQCSMT